MAIGIGQSAIGPLAMAIGNGVVDVVRSFVIENSSVSLGEGSIPFGLAGSDHWSSYG